MLLLSGPDGRDLLLYSLELCGYDFAVSGTLRDWIVEAICHRELGGFYAAESCLGGERLLCDEAGDHLAH